MGCRHCGRPKVNRPLGLCWRCYYTPRTREAYPSMSKYAPKGEPPEPKSDCRPTQALPGTPEKKAVMASRFLAGQPLFHPQDPVVARLPHERGGRDARFGKRLAGFVPGLKSSAILDRAFDFGNGGGA